MQAHATHPFCCLFLRVALLKCLQVCLLHVILLCDSEGVEVHPNRGIRKASMHEGKVKVTADDGTEVSWKERKRESE